MNKQIKNDINIHNHFNEKVKNHTVFFFSHNFLHLRIDGCYSIFQLCTFNFLSQDIL